MKVSIELTSDEIMEAVRAWMHEKGIPVVAIAHTRIMAKSHQSSSWSEMVELRMTCKYECDALGASTGDGAANPRVFTEPSTMVTGDDVRPSKKSKLADAAYPDPVFNDLPRNIR